MKRYDLIIVGAGPSGLSAAIEAAKKGLDVVVFDENEKPGGQLFKQIHKFFGSKEHRAKVRGFVIGQQLLDEGMTELQNIDLEMKVFFQEKLSSQALHQWVVEADGEIIATAAFLIVDLPPNFRNPSGKRGYITNVYTAPAHRRKGISERLMDILVQEAGETGITSMWLFASEQGESVYRKAGFTKRNDCMGWDAPAGACP